MLTLLKVAVFLSLYSTMVIHANPDPGPFLVARKEMEEDAEMNVVPATQSPEPDVTTQPTVGSTARHTSKSTPPPATKPTTTRSPRKVAPAKSPSPTTPRAPHPTPPPPTPPPSPPRVPPPSPPKPKPPTHKKGPPPTSPTIPPIVSKIASAVADILLGGEVMGR